MSFFKYLKRNKPKKNGEPHIGPHEVNAVEVNPLDRFENGRYVGRLLNPDDMFFPEKYVYPDSQSDAEDIQDNSP